MAGKLFLVHCLERKRRRKNLRWMLNIQTNSRNAPMQRFWDDKGGDHAKSCGNQHVQLKNAPLVDEGGDNGHIDHSQ